MADYHKRMKSLRIDNIPQLISDLKLNREDVCAQLDDLRKARRNLEIEAEQVNIGLCQIEDVQAKLHDNFLVTRKKVDDNLSKNREEQEFNTICSAKIHESALQRKQEEKDIVQWVSEWGNEISELSKKFKYYANLYKIEKLESNFQDKQEEESKAIETVEHLKKTITELQEKKDAFIAQPSVLDLNVCSQFLESNEAGSILELLTASDEQQSKTLDDAMQQQETMLLEEKKVLQNWIETSESQ